MASLQNPLKLIHLDKQDPDLQIADHRPPASIVVTHQKRRVTVYHVEDLKTSKVWSTKTGQEIVNRAVFDLKKQQYAALFSNKLLWQWNDENASIEKGTKVKLDKEAWSLLEGGALGSLVVYKDGSLSLLDDTETTSVALEEGTVQLCLSTVHQSCLYVAIVTDNQQVYIHKYSSAETAPSSFKFSLPKGTIVSRSTICFHKQGASLQLIIIGSKCSLFSLNVLDRESEWRKLAFPEARSPCIASLGSNFVAVGGLVSNGLAGLGIWDIKYGLMQSFKEFPEESSSCQQLFTSGSRLVLVCGANLYVCRYSIESASLAAALGRRLKEESAVPSVVSGSGDDSNLKQLLLSLTEKLKNVKSSEMETGLKNVAEMLAKANNQELVGIVSLVCQVLSRCAESDHLWLPNCFLQIVKRRPLPARLCENLILKALKKEDMLLVFNFARHAENVPEHILVKCLNFLLKCDDNQFTNAAKDLPSPKVAKEDAPIKCPFSGLKAATINVLLKLPYNDVFLQDCMKEMEFSAVLPLLQYLCYILVCSSLLSAEKDLGLSVLQVTDWVNITVDAHFAQLVLSVEARKLLVDLHQTVESQVNLLEELVSLEGILNQIKSKGGLPYREPPGIYNIHTLHIA